jgi:multiple sugar transport system ATP-binding protein
MITGLIGEDGLSMANVSIRNVTKKFGNVIAVNDMSLEIRDKEFLVMLGPSGSGKTTLLRCIAGLETPEKGEIYIGDSCVTNVLPKDRDVAMVFQSYALYPHMNVFDNIAFSLKIRKVPISERTKRVKEVADLLQIGHLLDRRPRQLSGGEAQRVALGRAIIRQPRVFLMDEPLSNLDAKLRLYMRMELKKLQKDLDITTIYVTHDQAEAMTMADRIAVMDSAVLQQLGSPDEIYNHPGNVFVAGFMGSPAMNFLDCTLVKEDKQPLRLIGEGFSFTIPKWMAEAVEKEAAASEFALGVRPEDILVQSEQIKGESIPAAIFEIEPLGFETVVDLTVGGKLLRMRTSADFKANPGDKLNIAFAKDKIHVFGKKTSKLII